MDSAQLTTHLSQAFSAIGDFARLRRERLGTLDQTREQYILDMLGKFAGLAHAIQIRDDEAKGMGGTTKHELAAAELLIELVGVCQIVGYDAGGAVVKLIEKYNGQH